MVRGDDERLLELARTEDLHALARLLDTGVSESFERHGVARLEHALQSLDADRRPLLAEDVRESALRYAAVKRHLAAFVAAQVRIAAAGVLALMALARRLAEAGAGAAADTPLRRGRALAGPEVVESVRHALPRRATLDDFDEVADFVDLAPDRRGVEADDFLPDAAEAEPEESLLLVDGRADARLDLTNPDLFWRGRFLLLTHPIFSVASGATTVAGAAAVAGSAAFVSTLPKPRARANVVKATFD